MYVIILITSLIAMLPVTLWFCPDGVVVTPCERDFGPAQGKVSFE